LARSTLVEQEPYLAPALAVRRVLLRGLFRRHALARRFFMAPAGAKLAAARAKNAIKGTFRFEG
jgi:hypothetical protein